MERKVLHTLQRQMERQDSIPRFHQGRFHQGPLSRGEETLKDGEAQDVRGRCGADPDTRYHNIRNYKDIQIAYGKKSYFIVFFIDS